MDRQQLLEAPAAEIADAICQLQALITAATAAQCEFIEVLDSRELFAEDGAPNSAAWLSAHLGIAHATAARLVGMATALRELPEVAARFREAALSADQVSVLTRAATPDDQAEWIDHAERLSVAGLQRLAASRRPYTREEAEDELAARSLVFRWDTDGRRVRFNGRLPAAEGNLVQKALERIADQMPAPPDGVASPSRMVMADALVELAATRVANDPDTDRATVVVHIDGQQDVDPTEPVKLEGPGVVAGVTAERMACDSREQTVTDSPVGGTASPDRLTEPVADTVRRTIPPWLRRFLLDRDDGRCLWPGCGHRRWLQHHHEHHFARGGPTVASNLVTVCGYHHRLVHEGGWRISRTTDGTVEVTRPDGCRYEPGPIALDPDIRLRFPLLE